MILIAKEYARIFSESGYSLHLIRRAGVTYQPYVVCWNLQYSLIEPHKAEWDWGTYSETLEQAWEVFNNKVEEYGFKLIA